MKPEEKKFILENVNKKSVKEIAQALGLKERRVRKFCEAQRRGATDKPGVPGRPTAAAEATAEPLGVIRILEKHGGLALAVVLAAAVVIRAVYFYQLTHSVFHTLTGLDESFYDRMATSIAHGQILRPTVFYSLPLYPYFMGLVYFVSHNSVDAMRLTQHALGVANCFLVYILAKQLFSRPVAIVAAGLFTLYGLFIFYEGQLLSVTLAMFLNLLTLVTLFRAFERKSRALFLAAGLLMGISALAMSGILLFVPCVVYGIFRFFKDRGPSLAATALLAAGLLGPITLATAHNYAAEKDFVLITAHSGITFYTGNNPEAKPYFNPIKEIQGADIEAFIYGSKSYAEKDLGRTLKPSEVSKYWSRKASKFISENPGRYLRLLAEKVLFFVNDREMFDVFVDTQILKSHCPVLYLTFLDFWFVAIFGALGIALNLRLSEKFYLVYSFMVSYMLSVILFMVNSRYRLPVVPVLAIFAAFGLIRFAEALKWKRNRFKCVVIVLVALVVVNLPLIQALPGKAQDIGVLGIGYQKRGELDKARETFEVGVKKFPQEAPLYNNLATVYVELGLLDKAVETAKKALELSPQLPEAHNTLGVAYKKMQRYDEAIEEFKTLIAMRPNDASYYKNLGNAYMTQGRNAEGIAQFEKAVEIQSEPEFYDLLGMAYESEGRQEDAVRAWERALALDPDYAPAKANLSKYKK